MRHVRNCLPNLFYFPSLSYTEHNFLEAIKGRSSISLWLMLKSETTEAPGYTILHVARSDCSTGNTCR